MPIVAGLRISELIDLHLDHVDQGRWASIHVMGKGRRERILPLWKETAAALKAWISIRPATAEPELFLKNDGHAMTRSDFAYILAKHTSAAAKIHLSIAGKSVTPYVLRHSCAMHTLKATRDIRQVPLWFGHASLQSTEFYLCAKPTEKLEALGAMKSPRLKPGRFRAPDKVLATLSEVIWANIMCSDSIEPP